MYLEWHTELKLLASAHGLSVEDAEDLASEVLLQYWKGEEGWHSKTILIERLFKQLRCHQRDAKRRKISEFSFLQLQLAERTFWQLHRFEDREYVLHLAQQLSPPEQLLLQCSLVEELDLPQIAERLQKSVSTVVNLCQYTIFNLKKILEKKDLIKYPGTLPVENR